MTILVLGRNKHRNNRVSERVTRHDGFLVLGRLVRNHAYLEQLIDTTLALMEAVAATERETALRQELKLWEAAFAAQHDGRKATREEIKLAGGDIGMHRLLLSMKVFV